MNEKNKSGSPIAPRLSPDCSPIAPRFPDCFRIHPSPNIHIGALNIHFGAPNIHIVAPNIHLAP
eukprot:653667-Prorocentrum_minimum.AAC.1